MVTGSSFLHQTVIIYFWCYACQKLNYFRFYLTCKLASQLTPVSRILVQDRGRLGPRWRTFHYRRRGKRISILSWFPGPHCPQDSVMRGSDGTCVHRGWVPGRSPELVNHKCFIVGSECPGRRDGYTGEKAGLHLARGDTVSGPGPTRGFYFCFTIWLVQTDIPNRHLPISLITASKPSPPSLFRHIGAVIYSFPKVLCRHFLSFQS